MYEYLLWLLVFVVLPICILWAFNFKSLKRYWRLFILTPIFSIIIVLPWDNIAIKKNIWYFTEPHIFGIWFLGLPIEEWMFVIFETILAVTVTILIWKKIGGKKC